MASQHTYAAASNNSVPAAKLLRTAPPQGRGFAPALAWCVLLGSLAITALLMHRAGLTVTIWTWSNLPYFAGLAIIGALRANWLGRGWRYGPALRDCAGYYAVFSGMVLIGAVASYPIAALTHGYADAMLARSDAALGFSWVALYEVVANYRVLQWLGIAGYESIFLTPAVLLGWFALTGERREAHRFLASFWLAAVFTLALFRLMPAVGPFSFLWHGPIRYMPVSELWQLGLIHGLREHTIHVVDIAHLRGLVSAPSFHAAAGALFLRSAWRAGPLRWPLVWVAGGMLLATPIEGTHYLTDVILGFGVAVLAMAIVDALLARQASASLRSLASAPA